MKGRLLLSIVMAALFLTGLTMVSKNARDTDEGPKGSDWIKIWEAYAKGYVTIYQRNDPILDSPLIFRVKNYRNVSVNINEYAMLLSPHPLQGSYIVSTQDGALTPQSDMVGPYGEMDFYYGDLTLPGQLYEGQKPWWCTERHQYTQPDVRVELGGEILPFVLEDMVKNPNGDTNTDIWNYLYENPTLVIGKTPLWKSIPNHVVYPLNVKLAVTNLAVFKDYGPDIPNAENSVVEDLVPPGYSYDPSGFNPTPDSIMDNPDGSTTLRWIVDVPAANVTDHDDEDPTPYQTVFLNYVLITPSLDPGRIFLPRSTVDVDGDGKVDAHSARPLLEVFYANVPPVPDAGGPYSADEGSDIVLDASSSFDPNGDTLTYRWDLNDDGTWDTPWSNDPTELYTCADDYSGRVALEVNDSEYTALAKTDLECRNVDPQITEILFQSETNEGASLVLTVSFSDPGWLDTHSAIVDWVYAPSEAPAITEENEYPDATGNFTATHTFGDDVSPIIGVTVLDDDGGHDYRTVPVDIMNVDPSFIGISYNVTYNSPRTQGYWKFQCEHQNPPSPDHVGIQQEFIDFIGRSSNVFSGVSTREDVCRVLEDANKKDMKEKAELQLMALWLNVASGKLSLNTTVQLPAGTLSLGEVISEIEETILNSNDTKELEWAKDIADDINNGKLIPLVSVSFAASAIDPGSDDLTFFWEWGDGFVSGPNMYYNNGVSPDPFRSPGGVYPFLVEDLASHSYWAEGTYYVTLSVSDDDGGFCSVVVELQLSPP